MQVKPGARFDVRMKELAEIVGDGSNLTGSVVVDQVYAQYQHEGLNLRHPRGGQAKYLEEPLLTNHNRYFTNVAKTVLRDGGENGMIKSVEHLSNQVKKLAPVEFGDLRRSGHPSVRSGAETVYDREPEVKRLSPVALRAKGRSRRSYDIE